MNDKFNTFFNTWNNKYCEAYDSQNLNQCYDLAVKWCQFLNVPFPLTLYAADAYFNHPPELNAIPNTVNNFPKVGDLVIWNRNFNGGPGHIGVATGRGDMATFDCFEQNDPTGSPCHVKTYNYYCVTGWLRPPQPPEAASEEVNDMTKDELIKFMKTTEFVDLLDHAMTDGGPGDTFYNRDKAKLWQSINEIAKTVPTQAGTANSPDAGTISTLIDEKIAAAAESPSFVSKLTGFIAKRVNA